MYHAYRDGNLVLKVKVCSHLETSQNQADDSCNRNRRLFKLSLTINKFNV